MEHATKLFTVPVLYYIIHMTINWTGPLMVKELGLSLLQLCFLIWSLWGQHEHEIQQNLSFVLPLSLSQARARTLTNRRAIIAHLWPLVLNHKLYFRTLHPFILQPDGSWELIGVIFQLTKEYLLLSFAGCWVWQLLVNAHHFAYGTPTEVAYRACTAKHSVYLIVGFPVQVPLSVVQSIRWRRCEIQKHTFRESKNQLSRMDTICSL